MRSGCRRSIKYLILLSLAVQALQAQDAILSGTVVTLDKVISKGWIVIREGRIESIAEKPPLVAKPPIVDTGGIIFPGFIDLHNHPMYNGFPRWHPTTKVKNRYEWRDLEEYNDLVGRLGTSLACITD